MVTNGTNGKVVESKDLTLDGVKKGDSKAAEVMVEHGVGSVLPGSVWSEWSGENTIALNKPVVPLENLIEMRRRDGQAKALTQLVTLPLLIALLGGEWVEPEEGDAEAETEFARQLWTLPPMAGGMTTPRSKVIRQMLLSTTDGFAAFEIVRHIPQKGPLKGKITLRKLSYRDPRTVKFMVDEKGGYAGFRQLTTDGNGKPLDVKIHPMKSFTVTHQEELNPHYGISMFESAYPHFDAKRKLYYIAHLAAQFAAVPGRLGKVPQNPKVPEMMAFLQALRDFSFNTAMVVPFGYDVVPFNNNSNYDFMKLIDHHNIQMSKSILASFFDSESRPVLIERSQELSSDLFLTCMETLAQSIAESLTVHLMPQFIDFNFTSGKYPIFRPAKLSDSSRALIGDLFKTVVTAGILNCTPEMVRELEKKVAEEANLDIDYTEIEKREQEAAEQKSQQEQEAAEAQAAAAEEAAAPPPDSEGSAPAPGGDSAPPAPASPDEGQVAQLSGDIDQLVAAAQALFLNRPEDPLDPVDAGL